MDASAKATLYGALIGVAGTMLGFLFSFLLESLRSHRRDRVACRGVRTLLRLEAEYGQMLLRSFWGELAQEDPSEVEGYLQGSKRVSKFLELQPPVWSHRVWESQMSQVAQALEQEEIRQLHFLHAGLETIVSIHNRIRHLDAEQEQVRTAQIDPFEKLSHPKTYGLITSGISLLSEVEKIATDVLSIPLLSIDGN